MYTTYKCFSTWAFSSLFKDALKDMQAMQAWYESGMLFKEYFFIVQGLFQCMH
jgi:hypothetical protein